jgi:hypothetical protein
MPKDDKKKYRGKSARPGSALPFSSQNYLFFGIGLVLIVIGYIALSRGPWDSFWSLTLAPILLVLGYCVLVPVAILYRKKNKKRESETK